MIAKMMKTQEVYSQ